LCITALFNRNFNRDSFGPNNEASLERLAFSQTFGGSAVLGCFHKRSGLGLRKFPGDFQVTADHAHPSVHRVLAQPFRFHASAWIGALQFRVQSEIPVDDSRQLHQLRILYAANDPPWSGLIKHLFPSEGGAVEFGCF
jgi:hypothetical protein